MKLESWETCFTHGTFIRTHNYHNCSSALDICNDVLNFTIMLLKLNVSISCSILLSAVERIIIKQFSYITIDTKWLVYVEMS